MIVVALISTLAASGVTGIVRDPSGAVVSGAVVVLRGANAERRLVTGTDGRFEFDTPPGGALTLVVRAAGFAEQALPVNVPAIGLEVRLAPASLVESVTVTAARAVNADAPAAATNVLTARVLETSPAATLDDQLKTIPGFSLFRRTSSRAANPTTQGVTMRGLSASGASRSLVLVDGVPLNDPFGGWVYWDRVPQTALDRIEVIRGGTSDLYGMDAVGGVIQVLTMVPGRGDVRLMTEYGERDTPRVSLYAGGIHAGWNGFASGEWQRSDGYIIVAPEQRGPVDTPAGAAYRTAYGSGGYQARTWRASIRGNLFHEDRQNGTPLTTNTTSARSGVGELSGGAFGGFWLVRGYGGTQGYDQGFSAVNATRTSESLTQLQHVPSANAGASAQWSGWHHRTTWTVGADLRRISGESDERVFTRGVQSGFTSLGGVEWEGTEFARASTAVTDRWTADLSASLEFWGLQPNQSVGFGSHVVLGFMPKIATTFRATDHVSLYVVANQAGRVPTLNELFRNFRVGNTVTEANNQLAPESLTGVEGGVTITGTRGSMRVAGFFNSLADAITNVTRSSSASLILRQRANAGTIHAAGADIEGEWQLVPMLRATIGAEFVNSVFADSQEPGLTGNRVPLVPRFHVSTGLRLNAPLGFVATAQLRATGSQFDDDRNQFLLGSATVFDAYVAKEFPRALQVYAAAENLTDAIYDVGRTPTRTIGLPRTVRVGVRVQLP